MQMIGTSDSSTDGHGTYGTPQDSERRLRSRAGVEPGAERLGAAPRRCDAAPNGGRFELRQRRGGTPIV